MESNWSEFYVAADTDKCEASLKYEYKYKGGRYTQGAQSECRCVPNEGCIDCWGVGTGVI